MESEMSPGGMFVQRREAAAAADNGGAAGNDNMTTVMVTVAHHSSLPTPLSGMLRDCLYTELVYSLKSNDSSLEEKKRTMKGICMQKVSVLEVAVDGGTKVSDKNFLMSTELLMRQLLKLDGIEAEGEVKLQRKAEVHRVQNFVDTLDSLKAKNSNPYTTIVKLSL
ncbi:BAG family molecular chaperone regulator 4 [Glycine soja]|uniref:BAG family molecular chaperone regulator 4 n=1 Tax=Glycine soja TaxID=3848 RepID=A0A445FVH4_GLYSO|nr:BAG family molecular chaperone regulator 4 [Glycine soja]